MMLSMNKIFFVFENELSVFASPKQPKLFNFID